MTTSVVLGAMGAAIAAVAVVVQSGDWTQDVNFQDCRRLEENSGYGWYASGATIGVKANKADGKEISNTRLKCIVRFPGFYATAMVISFDDSIWQSIPKREGSGGDRRIIVRDNSGAEIAALRPFGDCEPLRCVPRWKKAAEDSSSLRVNSASWTYLFDRPTPQVTITLRASDSWSDRQISWTIEHLQVRVLGADQYPVRSWLRGAAPASCSHQIGNP